MSNVQLWILIGLVGLVVLAFVVLFMFLARLHHKVNRIDHSLRNYDVFFENTKSLHEILDEDSRRIGRLIVDADTKISKVGIQTNILLRILKRYQLSAGSDPDDEPPSLHLEAFEEEK
jgi:hypothetical protein